MGLRDGALSAHKLFQVAPVGVPVLFLEEHVVRQRLVNEGGALRLGDFAIFARIR